MTAPAAASGFSPHADFAASRRVGYVERPGELKALDAFAKSSGDVVAPNVLLVTGDSGAGKSSLLAYWTSAHRGRHPRVFIVEHYVGCTGSSADHIEIVRRLIVAIRDRYEVREEIPTSRHRLEEDLPLWFGYVQTEDLLIVIDGLDQLDPISRSLAWLPEYLQPRVRMIVSSRDPEQCALLRARGCVDVEIQPLSRADRVAIARQHISSRSAFMTHAQVHRVTSAPASANPLFLRTSLEAVRAHVHHEGADERIDYYLAATGIDDLYRRLLDRLDGEFGGTFVGDVLCLTRASRRGLSRLELSELLNRPSELDSLLQRLEFFLVERSGRLSLLHQELRAAVQVRYVTGPDGEPGVHLRLADYLSQHAADAECLVELAWQLSRAGARDRLAEVLSDLCAFHALYLRDEGLELMRYVLELGEAFDPVATYTAEFDRRLHSGTECADIVMIGNELGAFLQLGFSPAAAVDVLSQVVGLLEHRGESGIQRARVHLELGIARRSSGDLAGAESDLQRALSIIETIEDAPREEVVRCRCAMSELLYLQADNVRAERILRETAQLAQQWFGRDHIETARVLADLGATEFELRRFSDAEETLQRALELSERLLGPDHPQTAQAVNNLAAVLQGQGRLEQAIALLQRAADINRRVLGPNNAEYAVNLVNLGMLRKLTRDYALAAKDYEQAITILRANGRGNSPSIATAMINLGRLYIISGRYSEAQLVFGEVLEILTAALGPFHRETLWTEREYTMVIWAQGDVATAERRYRHTLETLKSVPGTDVAYHLAEHDLERMLAGGAPEFRLPT